MKRVLMTALLAPILFAVWAGAIFAVVVAVRYFYITAGIFVIGGFVVIAWHIAPAALSSLVGEK